METFFRPNLISIMNGTISLTTFKVVIRIEWESLQIGKKEKNLFIKDDGGRDSKVSFWMDRMKMMIKDVQTVNHFLTSTNCKIDGCSKFRYDFLIASQIIYSLILELMWIRFFWQFINGEYHPCSFIESIVGGLYPQIYCTYWNFQINFGIGIK